MSIDVRELSFAYGRRQVLRNVTFRAEPVEIPEWFPFYSLVNITGTARGITETGCKFPLDNGEIHCGYQYGTSNEVLPGQIAVVSVKEGLLLLIKDFPEVQRG